MVRRNELVLEASKSFETGNRMEAGQPAKGAMQLGPLRYQWGYPPLGTCFNGRVLLQVEKRIQNINAYYTHLITDARGLSPIEHGSIVM